MSKFEFLQHKIDFILFHRPKTEQTNDRLEQRRSRFVNEPISTIIKPVNRFPFLSS